MKELNSRVQAQIKRIYQINEQDYAKVAKLEAKKQAIDEELAMLKEGIDASEERVKAITGGYTSKDLVHTVVTSLFNQDGTPKVDKNGYTQKSKKYVFEYPHEDITPEEVASEDITPENIETL